MWEDVLCAAFGDDWRSVRGSKSSVAEWRSLFLDAVKRLFEQWHLPYKADKLVSVPVPETINQLAACPPEEPVEAPISLFQTDVGPKCCSHFGIVVDNFVLASTVCGDKCLRDVSQRPTFVRICNRLDQWLASDWKHLGHMPIIWRPRELNRRADQLANRAMDQQSSFSHTFPLPAKHVNTCIVIGCSDGGPRKTNEGVFVGAAAGWIVLAIDNHSNTVFVLEESALLLSRCGSAFEAELIGLDALSQSMSRHMFCEDGDLNVFVPRLASSIEHVTPDAFARVLDEHNAKRLCGSSGSNATKKRRITGPRGKGGKKRPRVPTA